MYRSRYRRITGFFARVILSLIGWDLILPKLGLGRISAENRKERMRKIATRYRALAVDMGGVMIKLGQFMSARLDVLPTEITDELAGLQDEVQPETYDSIRKVIVQDFGGEPESRFVSIDPQPIAAASIGQVHAACLRLENGEERRVVVKVQRPDIDKIVEVDLKALKRVGGWLSRYRPISKHVNVPALLEEFGGSLYEEIDYIHEGHNAEKFAENFMDDPGVKVPRVYWETTTRRVLTLEDVGAIKITDYAAITAAGVSRAAVAQRLFQTYLKQIFEDRFFHADPHPGNLFVLPTVEEDGQMGFKLVFIDFGMTGSITDTVLAGLREGLIALGTKDSTRVIKAYQILDVLLPEADIDLLQRATARVFDSFWGKTAPEMMQMHPEEAKAFVEEFNDLVYEMPIQAPENVVLLVRCLGILSGICTGLDVNFNIFTQVVPYAEKIMKDEASGNWRYWLSQLTDYLQVLISLPKRTESLLSRFEQGKVEVRTPELTNRVARVDFQLNRLVAAVVFLAFIYSATQVYLAGQIVIAAGLGAAAVVTLGVILFSRPRG